MLFDSTVRKELARSFGATLMVILTIFTVGIGLLFSVLNVYFRDLQYLVAIALQLWFYATPIIYPYSRVPGTKTYGGHTIPIRAIYTVINPMVGFVESFRAVLYDRHWPPLSMVGYATVWSLAMLWVGIVVFRRFEPRLAEEL